ncbi:MAG: response regulator [Thermodesulfovibrionia bacterium]
MTEVLMNIKQVAKYLQMNKMTVYKLAREGKIPAFKVASEWRFKKELIDEWLMKQLQGKPEVEGLGNAAVLKFGKTVLVVDDDRIIRDFFARSLSEFEVSTAASGHEALDMIKKNRPDLVLLDIQMPGIDGIETLKQIKQIDKNIVVIMLSAYGTLDTNIEAAHLGAYTSIAKPFDLGDMKLVIKNAMVSSG